MPKEDQGVQKKRFQLIPRTLTFLFNENKVLLIKGSDNKRLWAGLYNGIGGHVEPGEDVVTSAIREFYEETGLHLHDIRLCGVVTIDVGADTGVGIFVFQGNSYTGKLSSSEEGSLEWIDLQRLTQLPLVEDLPVIIPAVLAIRKDAAPFSAHYHYELDGKLNISFHRS